MKKTKLHKIFTNFDIQSNCRIFKFSTDFFFNLDALLNTLALSKNYLDLNY